MRYLFFCFFIASCGLHSQPQSAVVVRGSAEFEEIGKTLKISAADKTQIDWNSFSISKDETVHFLLPGATSCIMNRVRGSDPSGLFGLLKSNGQVILINRHGVWIGPDAKIDVGSFVASTFDILEPGEKAGSILLEGSIRAETGDVILLSPNIQEKGSIAALNGRAAVYGSSTVYVDLAAIQEILEDCCGVSEISVVEIQGDVAGKKIELEADQAIVSGKGFLRANQIEMQGKSIYLSPESTLSVDGTQEGGSLSIFSEGLLQAYGTLSARGGMAGGDGGVIKLCAGMLDFQGKVDTRAMFGKTGELVLDPLSIEIVQGIVDLNIMGGPVYQPNASPSQISQGTINTALGTSNVTVQSTGGGGPDTGDVFMVADYIIAPVPLSANTLTLSSFRDIYINAALVYPTTGSIVLNAPNGTIQVGNAPVAQTSDARVSADLGTVTATAANVIVEGNGAGPFFAQIGSPVLSGNTSNISITTTQDVSVLGDAMPGSYALIGHGVLASVAGDDIFGDIEVAAGGDIIVTGGVGMGATGSFAQIGHFAGTDAFTVNVSGDITVSAGGSVSMQGGSQTSFALIGHGGIGFNNAAYSGAVRVSASGFITLVGGSNRSDALIGMRGDSFVGSVGGLTVTSPLVGVWSNTGITLTPGSPADSGAIIGGRMNGGGALSSLTLDRVDVSTPGDIRIDPSGNSSPGLIGATAGSGNGIDANLFLSAGGDVVINNIGGGDPSGITNYPFSGAGFATNATFQITARNLIAQTDSNGSPIILGSSGIMTINVANNIQLTGVGPTAVIAALSYNGLDIFAGNDILITGQNAMAFPPPFLGTAGFMSEMAGGTVEAGRDIILADMSGALVNITAVIGTSAGNLDVIAGRDIEIQNNTAILSADGLNVVVDNDFPSPPQIGPGALRLLPRGRIDLSAKVGQLRIFTALQNQNMILGTISLGGTPATFIPGPLYGDVPPEKWGVYFFDPFFYNGQIFTIFYKDMLDIVPVFASTANAEMLYNLNVQFNLSREDFFDLWNFAILYERTTKPYCVASNVFLPQEPYWILRKRIHMLSEPYVNRTSLADGDPLVGVSNGS